MIRHDRTVGMIVGYMIKTVGVFHHEDFFSYNNSHLQSYKINCNSFQQLSPLPTLWVFTDSIWSDTTETEILSILIT